MVRPSRNKKPVNYSQFEDSGDDSDDDFIAATMPRNKKSKTLPKELKQDKPKPNLKIPQKEDILPAKVPKKRMALDDKVFQRGLEVALALSVKELPKVTNQVQNSQEKRTDKQGDRKTEIMDKSPPVSTCSVTGDDSDLDKVLEEGDAGSVEGERKTCKTEAQWNRVPSESSAGDTEPDSATGEDSENDSNFEESEGSDEDFAVRKGKAGEKKKAVQRKPTVEKEKQSKQKKETSVGVAPAAIKSRSPSLPEAVGLSSEAIRKPAKMCSPSAEGKRPKWVPPAASGSRNSSSSPLAGASTKSPSQSLRLGLSRLAPVKCLHPNAISSQVR
ncbi:RAD51-associated protein 1 isoform X2 [Arvicola amphibius]|uniref:RAD51-associated protein 1 isoform X2 n=1 Tax=Arvicola amphibius TaxID=1047088 RepID=UPI0018E3D5C7|nr:RAD51-associated protein 1 isoform X2 [Arvicola amphibius]